MITIEDTNNEHYHINPCQVIYVKERRHRTSNDLMFKILLSNGEVIMTGNATGANKIINNIKNIAK